MIAFDNSYARLPDRFFARVAPARPPEPAPIRINDALAGELGIDADWLRTAPGFAMLSGEAPPVGADPIALAYAGHQFGHFQHQLGDGRAVLLGEVIDVHGRRRDIQLKGAGRTPFSRGGDGRAVLGPVMREYLLSEAMAALGIPTTRALAAVVTGEAVARDRMLPGAVLTRVAASHVRVGTFQFFAARQDTEALRLLADHVIARHYPDAAHGPQPYRALLGAVIAAQAALVARWLQVGFVHGVMNTDNMSIAGETIDYGPCAFLDAYDPGAVFSSIDRQGRYAYANQPRIAQWNLTRLAEAMLPLFAEDPDAAVTQAEEALAAFAPAFDGHYRTGMLAKIGVASERDGDADLLGTLLTALAEGEVDFTLFFRSLGAAVAGDNAPARALFADPAAFDAWMPRWHARLAEEGGDARARMDAVNPAFIPRNHQVEAMIAAALEGDFAPFEALLDVLSRPYEDQPDAAHLAVPPLAHERVTATFCGT
ncbi:MAG TPA: YdiU family protein [Sphingomonas sp.]|jgi:uncharacterized protein YdiU (UPF0061 family)